MAKRKRQTRLHPLAKRKNLLTAQLNLGNSMRGLASSLLLVMQDLSNQANNRIYKKAKDGTKTIY